MTPNIIVLGNRALIEIEGANSSGGLVKKGGIIVPETVARESVRNHAHIVVLGDGPNIHPALKTALKKHQRVLVSQFSGVNVEVDGRKYKLISTEDIFAIKTK